jgi:hypothetical protein
MRNPEISMRLSTPKEPIYKTIPPQGDEVSETLEYYAAYMTVGCTPYGEEGEGKYVLRERYLGAAKDRPWTPQEVAYALKAFTNMHTVCFNELKELSKDATGLVIEN